MSGRRGALSGLRLLSKKFDRCLYGHDHQYEDQQGAEPAKAHTGSRVVPIRVPFLTGSCCTLRCVVGCCSNIGQKSISELIGVDIDDGQ